MKCIDKLLSLLLVACLGLGLVSCGSESTDQTSYDLETTSYQYGITKVNNISDVSFYGSNLCVTDQDNFGIDQVDSHVAEPEASLIWRPVSVPTDRIYLAKCIRQARPRY